MRRLKAGICLLLILFVINGCASQTNKDNITKKATDPKVRIVATTFAITEIMDQLGLELVGVPTTEYKLPNRYKKATEVGNPMSPDMEIIKTLDPTEVLSVTTLKYDLSKSFKDMDIPASYLNLQSVEGLNQSIKDLGKKNNREKRANDLVDSIEAKIKNIQEQTSHKKHPKVLILLGIPGSYLVATEHSYVGNLVEVAGGRNAIKGQSVEYISANTEYLQKSNPDTIIRLSHGIPDEVTKMFNQEFQKNDIWKHFNAVKNNRVYDLKEPLFGTTANLHVDEALDELVEILYK